MIQMLHHRQTAPAEVSFLKDSVISASFIDLFKGPVCYISGDLLAEIEYNTVYVYITWN